MSPGPGELDALWAHHHGEWRDPAQVAGQWAEASVADRRLLRMRTRGSFWEVLAEHALTLLVTREYEHLVMALAAPDGAPRATYMRLPHPSGLTVDRERGVVHVASTRNPNQVYTLAPATGHVQRADAPAPELGDRPLLPVASCFHPGALYLHDLALIGGILHGNAVGMNAVVRLAEGAAEPVWWPKSVERRGRPDMSRNYLQLNSIAAGPTVEESYFSSSSSAPGARRPGHRNYLVDGRGVVFSGATREPVAGGLTRPHSARLNGGRLWVDNSGYGELCVRDGERFEVRARLPGWTRGLCFAGGTAFVGTSRVIPRFRSYAPGLDVDRSVCGVHAVDTESGAVLGSLLWPSGNQIFAVEAMPAATSLGFAASTRGERGAARMRSLFYGFTTSRQGAR